MRRKPPKLALHGASNPAIHDALFVRFKLHGSGIQSLLPNAVEDDLFVGIEVPVLNFTFGLRRLVLRQRLMLMREGRHE